MVGPIKKPVMLKYTGSRQGSFGVTGRVTGRSYRVPGRGMSFIVESIDVEYIVCGNLGRDFVRTQK